jgi:hypothetical protein
MTFTAGIALAIASVFSGSSATSVAYAQVQAQPMPQAQSVQEYVKTYFADEPIMYAIAGCESHYHQYDSNGSIYRGVVNNLDVGVLQINEHYHAAIAAKLGLDLYTMQGNAAYAQYLYDKEGTAPWSSSQACWGKSQAAKDLAIASNK